MKKPAFVLLVLVILLTMPIHLYAETYEGIQAAQDSKASDDASISEAISLTLDDCMNRAVEYSHQTEVLDQQMDDLWKQHNDLMEMSNAIQQQLDVLGRFRRLYEQRENGITFTIEEQAEFDGYQYMFGMKPPEYTDAEMFSKYIKNRDLPHYSVWAAVQNLNTNKAALAASVKMGVKQLFDGVIDMQDTLLLQQQLYGNMKKQNEQMLVKYESGLVSEINKYISETALEKQRLTIEKLERSLENMMMSLKQQLGIPLRQEITLVPYGIKGIKPANTYSYYLKDGLKNRSEIIIAGMDLQVEQRENDIIKQYYKNEFLTERMEADQALEEKKITYKEAVNNVTADISSGFKDVQLKNSSFYISLAKLQLEEGKLKDAELKYNKGMVSIVDLWNTEISATQARISYNRAMRDYNNAVYKLEAACGIGPGYTSGSGGY